MQRRKFIMALGGAAAGWPIAALAQQPAGRVYRLAFGSWEQQIHLSKAFEEGLRSLGYRVGENVVIEYRFANGMNIRPGIRPKDATDKEARSPRFRGRSVVVLYNSVRTHRSLYKDAPISRPIHQTRMIRSHPILGGLHHHYVRV